MAVSMSEYFGKSYSHRYKRLAFLIDEEVMLDAKLTVKQPKAHSLTPHSESYSIY